MLTDVPPGDKSTPEYLQNELRGVNAHAPKKQKTLRELLREAHPHVVCSDGSNHYFRRKELEYLSEMIYEPEQDFLLLPIIIEVSSHPRGVIVRSRKGIEARILSKILGMPLNVREDTIRLYRPQLSVVRKSLKTTSQYVFF